MNHAKALLDDSSNGRTRDPNHDNRIVPQLDLVLEYQLLPNDRDLAFLAKQLVDADDELGKSLLEGLAPGCERRFYDGILQIAVEVLRSQT